MERERMGGGGREEEGRRREENRDGKGGRGIER